MLHTAALLNAEQSRNADEQTIESGISGSTLMENAGRAVADVICEAYNPCPVLVVCGTGNNGGDGFIVARWLKQRGWPVTASVVGQTKDIRGDANIAMHKWETAGGGNTVAFDNTLLAESALVVDALFGTGLSRDVDSAAKKAITAINDSRLPVVAVDIASGIDASDGTIKGVAIRATHTVTFLRPKIGHVLLPGKAHTGQLHVFDIGITGNGIAPDYFLNAPALWFDKFPVPGPYSHKYSRGHAIILGGGIATTGASRLAATAALRAGAGLVSLVCSPEALPVYAAALTAVMTKPVSTSKELDTLLEDERITAICIGPGYGVQEKTRERVVQLLKSKRPCVLDADALSAFKTSTKSLFSAIGSPCVLTPHEGEFSRLFPSEGLKTDRARDAAKKSGAVVVFKGNDTVIAAPDGRVVINAEAPVWLATAGSGDVLSGLICGMLAQGMPAFEAACAGVWIHSHAAAVSGPGLIADDLPALVPNVLKSLFAKI